LRAFVGVRTIGELPHVKILYYVAAVPLVLLALAKVAGVVFLAATPPEETTYWRVKQLLYAAAFLAGGIALFAAGRSVRGAARMPPSKPE